MTNRIKKRMSPTAITNATIATTTPMTIPDEELFEDANVEPVTVLLSLDWSGDVRGVLKFDVAEIEGTLRTLGAVNGICVEVSESDAEEGLGINEGEEDTREGGEEDKISNISTVLNATLSFPPPPKNILSMDDVAAREEHD